MHEMQHLESSVEMTGVKNELKSAEHVTEGGSCQILRDICMMLHFSQGALLQH